MHLLATICAALSLGPVDATRLACRLERYEPCDEVLRLVAVESRGVAVGVHTRHRARISGGVFWRKSVAIGLLHPERCERHQSTDNGFGWGVRGSHGLAAAYSVHALGECVGPEAIDVPLLSAVATIRRLRALRDRYGLKTEAERGGLAERGWRSMNRKYKNSIMEALSLEVEYGGLQLPHPLPPPDYWPAPPVLGLWRFSTLGGPWAPPSTSGPKSTR